MCLLEGAGVHDIVVLIQNDDTHAQSQRHISTAASKKESHVKCQAGTLQSLPSSQACALSVPC